MASCPGLDKSITLSHNFFNDVNANDYFINLLRKLPKLARRIGHNEPLRKTLGIKWDLQQFMKKLNEP